VMCCHTHTHARTHAHTHTHTHPSCLVKGFQSHHQLHAVFGSQPQRGSKGQAHTQTLRGAVQHTPHPWPNAQQRAAFAMCAGPDRNRPHHLSSTTPNIHYAADSAAPNCVAQPSGTDGCGQLTLPLRTIHTTVVGTTTKSNNTT
jgi:hypothetical protein